MHRRVLDDWAVRGAHYPRVASLLKGHKCRSWPPYTALSYEGLHVWALALFLVA